MLIYSKKIARFIEEIKRVVRDVLSKEMRMDVYKGYFYSHREGKSYPISIVVYNDKSMLGYFDSHFLEMGFHEKLMYVSRGQLESIIKHELAHYYTFIRFGTVLHPHGPEFKSICDSLYWKEEISRASVCLDTSNELAFAEESDVFRKVQKLMALSTSSNKHEAEQAMIKSQQLLLKHNLEESCINIDDEEKFVLKRILKQKKKDAKMRAIAAILDTFFVSCVFNRAEEYTYLEILGSQVNVQIAEYVAEVLLRQMDLLWDLARKQHDLKGSIAKNSFLLGISKGYLDKVRSLQKIEATQHGNALTVIERKLTEAKAMAYGRLSFSRSYGRYCPESAELGKQAGNALSINPGLHSSAKHSGVLLTRK